MTFREVYLALSEKFAWWNGRVEERTGRVYLLFNHQNLTNQNRSSGQKTQLSQIPLLYKI
jgi:hypothetical protein